VETGNNLTKVFHVMCCDACMSVEYNRASPRVLSASTSKLTDQVTTANNWKIHYENW